MSGLPTEMILTFTPLPLGLAKKTTLLVPKQKWTVPKSVFVFFLFFFCAFLGQLILSEEGHNATLWAFVYQTVSSSNPSHIAALEL